MGILPVPSYCNPHELTLRAGGMPTPQEKMTMSGMGILPVLAYTDDLSVFICVHLWLQKTAKPPLPPHRHTPHAFPKNPEAPQTEHWVI